MFIFLDIDGVMVPAKSWSNPNLLEDGFYEFSNKAVLAIQKLIFVDTKIILTTSHKSRYSIEEWKAIFNKRGIQVAKLEKLPDNNLDLNRKDEIINWFDSNVIKEDFIIVDDDKSLNDLPEILKEHLILTSPMIGLTEAHLEEIRLILDQKI